MTASSVTSTRAHERAGGPDREWCDVDSAASARLRTRLARTVATRYAGDAAWLTTLLAVPRHHFAPQVHVERPGAERARDRLEAPGREWLRTVYQDRELVTRTTAAVAADAHGMLMRRAEAVQCLAPSSVLATIEALGVAPGARVLHVEGGTGYVTALLAARLGAGVIAVLPTAQECWSAQMRLGDLGLFPRLRPSPTHVLPGRRDGVDAVLSTVAAPSVPMSWVRQVRPGGRLLVVLDRRSAVRPVLALTGRGSEVAEGRFTPVVLPAPPPARRPPLGRGAASPPYWTPVRPEMVRDPSHPFALFVALRMPGLQHLRTPGGEVFHARDGSWVRFRALSGPVEQGGPRHLWSEVEECHRRWVGLGRPTASRFGVTVTPRGTALWLDEPRNDLSTRGPEGVR